MTTLTDFLLARIADDEKRARFVWSQVDEYSKAHRYEEWRLSWHDEYDLLCIEPDRAIAECEAKRRIVELHVPDRHLENWYWPERKCAECGGRWHVITPFAKPTDIGAEQGCPTLRLLALPYADHPDYDESWRP